MPHLFSAKMLRKEAHEIVGYFMRHKTGFDVAFSWNKDDPDFSEKWERIPAMAQPAPASTGRESLDVEFKRLADTILQATANGARLEALRSMAALFDSLAAPIAARELDVEAERREFEASEIAYQQDRHPQEPLTAEEKAYLLRRDPQQRDTYAACGGEWEGWLRRAGRSAAQGTAPASNAMMDAWSRYIIELEQKVVALEAQVASRPESTPVSTEQAGDAWISVEDRLPDESLLRFLVTGRAVSGGPLGVHIATLYDGDMYFEGAAESGGCNPCINDVVTHWMPLPGAPSPNNSPMSQRSENGL